MRPQRTGVPDGGVGRQAAAWGGAFLLRRTREWRYSPAEREFMGPSMRHLLAAVAPALLAGGCGLVELPASQTYPGPLKGVRVLDSDCGRPLRDAVVRFDIARYENWFRMIPRLAPVDRGDPSPASAAREPVHALRATSPAPGTFVFESRSLRGSKVIWFPLPPVLGNVLHREHRGFLHVSAPGYAPVVFSYCPEVPPATEAEYATGEDKPARATLRPDGTLDVYLVRGRRARAPLPLGAQGLSAEGEAPRNVGLASRRRGPPALSSRRRTYCWPGTRSRGGTGGMR